MRSIEQDAVERPVDAGGNVGRRGVRQEPERAGGVAHEREERGLSPFPVVDYGVHHAPRHQGQPTAGDVTLDSDEAGLATQAQNLQQLTQVELAEIASKTHDPSVARPLAAGFYQCAE